MLKDKLYTVSDLARSDGNIRAVLEINRNHEIFGGHFPGRPVLPGACMLQMLKEVLEEASGKGLKLKTGNNLKCLQIIDPQINHIINLNINFKYLEDNDLSVAASLKADETICFKFTGVFH